MSITKNYFYNTLLQVTNVIVPFITVPYISRVLGPEGVGTVAFTGSVVRYFVLFGSLGIILYGNRTIAYVRDNIKKRSTTFWELFFLKLITTGIAIFLFICFLFIFKPSHYNIYLIQSLLLVGAALDISWFFMGLEDFQKIVFRGLITKVLGVLVIFIFVKESNDAIMYALATAGSTFLGQLVIWSYLPKYIKWEKISLKNIYSHLKGTASLFIPLIAIQIYTVLDKTMIGIISNESEVGIYEMSQRLIKLALMLVTSMGVVMIPRISKYVSENDKENINKYSYKSFNYATYGSTFLLFMIFGIIPNFVPIFFGNSFLKAISVIRVISPILIFIAWSNVLGMQLMVPLKLEKNLTISVTLGATVNFLLNLIFIPFLGAIGAGISSVFAEFMVTLTQFIFMRKLLKIKNLFSEFWKHIISGFIVLFIINFISLLSLNIIIIIIMQIIIGTFVFLLAEFLLKSEMNKLVLTKIRTILKRILRYENS